METRQLFTEKEPASLMKSSFHRKGTEMGSPSFTYTLKKTCISHSTPRRSAAFLHLPACPCQMPANTGRQPVPIPHQARSTPAWALAGPPFRAPCMSQFVEKESRGSRSPQQELGTSSDQAQQCLPPTPQPTAAPRSTGEAAPLEWHSPPPWAAAL